MRKEVVHLSDALKCQTISYMDKSLYNVDEFKKFHSLLFNSFPHLMAKATYEIINECSILFHLKGTDNKLKPALFMAHIDVVGIVDNTYEDWTYPPFSGYIDEKYIWGRGAIDTKCMVMGELEAIEELLSRGMMPKRDIYFAYGHDEETNGGEGHKKIAELLMKRNITLEYVIDEGGTYENATIYGAPDKMIAPVGIFEKGYLDVILETFSDGGHSSNPYLGSSLGVLCKAISNIENNQFKPFLPQALKVTFEQLAPYISIEPLKTYASDIVKYEKELIEYCYNDSNLNPYVHTTIATTMLDGGSKGANVLPQSCKALINLRNSEIDSINNIIDHFNKHAGFVKLSFCNALEPSKTSIIKSNTLDVLQAVIDKYIPKCEIVPILLCGGTDCRFYQDLSDQCYRFSPFPYEKSLHKTIHATNERMPIDGYLEGIKIFVDFMELTCF